MQLFYLENPENEIILSAEESKHVTKVLRKKEGDILNFTDGKGGFYKAEITIADTKKCRLQIISSEQKEKQHNYHLHIAIAPTKNMDRFEWFLEKATEIGIDEITPIICRHSERKIIKTERCKKILLSAMKQSLKFHLPKLNDPILFSEFKTKYSLETKIRASGEIFLEEADRNESKYIAHCEKSDKFKKATGGNLQWIGSMITEESYDRFKLLYRECLLTDSTSFDFNSKTYVKSFAKSVVKYVDDNNLEEINKLELRKEKRSEKTLILIGPEGDFSFDEIEWAVQNRFKEVSLGTSRLRTETAGIVAVHTINIKD